MSPLAISVNPSYYCNFRCSFCYLSKEQLGTSRTLEVEKLYLLLNEVAAWRSIQHVELYGGEPALLSDKYLDEFLKIVRVFYAGRINVISNFSVFKDKFLTDDFELSVSWDFTVRQKSSLVYQNMMSIRQPFHVLTLASREMVDLSDENLDAFIEQLNALPYLNSWEIKPYSKSSFNEDKVKDREFEIFIRRLLQRRHKFKFDFINEFKIQESLRGVNNAWSDDHVYITPEGKWSVLDFDDSGKESFTSLESFSDYIEWTQKERGLILKNDVCSKCQYLGVCLSEHLRPVHAPDDSCNGFVGLLDWYKNGLQD